MATITQRVVRRARARGNTVLTRDQWGSKYAAVYTKRRAWTRLGIWGRFRRRADTVVQHITVTDGSADTLDGFKAACRTVEQIGYARFGSGVSYNFLVHMRHGWVAVGQPLDAKGTHTVNDKGVPGFSHDQNLVARAIAVVGMPGDQLSDKASEAISRLLAAMVDEDAITGTHDYLPHSKFAAKDCPCAPTRDRMPRIRARVDELRAVRDNRTRRKQRARSLAEVRARAAKRDAA